jgi:hypothetical protein
MLSTIILASVLAVPQIPKTFIADVTSISSGTVPVSIVSGLAGESRWSTTSAHPSLPCELVLLSRFTFQRVDAFGMAVGEWVNPADFPCSKHCKTSSDGGVFIRARWKTTAKNNYRVSELM